MNNKSLSLLERKLPDGYKLIIRDYDFPAGIVNDNGDEVYFDLSKVSNKCFVPFKELSAAFDKTLAMLQKPQRNDLAMTTKCQKVSGGDKESVTLACDAIMACWANTSAVVNGGLKISGTIINDENVSIRITRGDSPYVQRGDMGIAGKAEVILPNLKYRIRELLNAPTAHRHAPQPQELVDKMNKREDEFIANYIREHSDVD